MYKKQVPELYEHQKSVLEFIKGKRFFALFMEMGTGKSKVIVEKAFQLYSEREIDCVLVISPNAVKSQWVEEQFEIHFPSDEWNGYIWDGAKTKRSQKAFHEGFTDRSKLFVFSANIEAFQAESIGIYAKALVKEKKIFVVVDESTRIKNGRRKPVKGKRAGAKRTNKLLDLFKNAPYKAILTGTPTPNNPFDLWSQFEFLKADFFERDYFYFTHHYGIMMKHSNHEGKQYFSTIDEKSFNIIKSRLAKIQVERPLNSRDIEELALSNSLSTKDIITINGMSVFASFKNLKELKERMSPVTFFINKKDCLDLPDKVYETLYCKMGSDQDKIYKDLKKKMYAEYDGNELTVTTKMVMAMRLQMITGGLFPYEDGLTPDSPDKWKYAPIGESGKLIVLMEDLEEVPANTSIIVWAQFRGEIDMISEKLTEGGYSNAKFYGGSGYDVIDDFKSGNTRILVSNPVKGGEGLNLQISTLQYFYSNSFRADSRLQAEDRSHRIGQVNKVTYKDLICKGTIDEHVYNVLKRKGDLIEYFRSKSTKEFLEI